MRTRTKHVRIVFAVTLSVVLLGAPASTPVLGNDIVLLDFSAGFNTKSIRVNPGATLALRAAGEKVILHVDVNHAHPFPGIELPCPVKHWDLSKFAYIDIELRNPTDREVPVNARVDNPNADGIFHCANGDVTISPHSTALLRVALRRLPPEGIKVSLFGMNGYPWGIAQHWGKPGEGAIDAENVTNLVVYVSHPTEDFSYEVLSVRAGGTYEPPTPLLNDPDRFFPFIDSFGQYIHRDWPGKTHAIADMNLARDKEAADLMEHPEPNGWDQFGGWKDGPRLPATHYFRTVKHAGKWWLVDPEGRLFFSQGIDCVTNFEGATPIDERDKWFADLPVCASRFKDCYSTAWDVVHGHYQGRHPLCFDFGKSNLMRKYGERWSAIFCDLSHQRLRSWGINTIGNWSSPDVYLQHSTPYTVGFGHGGKMLAGSSGYWGKFRDVFDPSFAAEVRKAARDGCKASAQDPWCIGYFVDNELSWGDDGVSLALAALGSPGDQAAKIVFASDLKSKYGTVEQLNAAWGTSHSTWEALLKSVAPPDLARARVDLEAFYLKFARVYFKTIRDAIRQVDSNHLYLGCRFAWTNAIAAAAAAEFCDVVTFNIYRRTPTSMPLPLKADMPVMIGEFHVGALDRGMFHPGLVAADNQDERAAIYKGYVEAALKDDRMIGCHWYKYMDEPTVGRFYDGENYQIGFVDIVDTPYPEIIGAARDVGARMYDIRSNGASTRKSQ